MFKALASNTLTVLIVLLAVGAAAVAWGQRQFVAAGPLEQAICFRVPAGSGMSSVSSALSEQGAISNARIFRMGADYTEKTDKLKAGSFLVQPGTTMEEVLSIVTEGGRSTCGTQVNYRVGVLRSRMVVRELDPATEEFIEIVNFEPGVEEIPPAFAEALAEPDAQFRITLAEGVTSWQVVESLKQVDFLTGTVSTLPPEGSLAPDSYEVVKGSERLDVIERMQVAQTALLAELWEQRAPDLPLASPEEALVLASIVEKETGVAEERRQVASVFTNRLNQGMKLQTDPTVIYGVTKGQGSLGRGLRQSELRSRTPFNTYVIPALPPTPIANPGRASIEAALNPDNTPYIFFVADGTGGHAFAVTLAEHNANVSRWRKIEAERANQ